MARAKVERDQLSCPLCTVDPTQVIQAGGTCLCQVDDHDRVVVGGGKGVVVVVVTSQNTFHIWF